MGGRRHNSRCNDVGPVRMRGLTSNYRTRHCSAPQTDLRHGFEIDITTKSTVANDGGTAVRRQCAGQPSAGRSQRSGRSVGRNGADPKPSWFGRYVRRDPSGALDRQRRCEFPHGAPWAGGTKVWHDQIFVMDLKLGTWSTAEQQLPNAVAYGVSVSHQDGVIVCGGDDGTRVFRDVYRLTYLDQRIGIETLPPLPQPCTQMSGALVGDTLYVAGGIDRLDATTALNTFWSLDLSARINGLSCHRYRPDACKPLLAPKAVRSFCLAVFTCKRTPRENLNESRPICRRRGNMNLVRKPREIGCGCQTCRMRPPPRHHLLSQLARLIYCCSVASMARY